ncbi:putative disease resistance protein At1g61300 [Curcuma longa]|uniref:putative disease resistance protein At1g61300 n=1 Tax=Curcuma longa TaxID=136217 RepID=UPI003D9F2796
MSVNIDIVQILNRIWDAASIYLAKPRSGVEDLGRAAEQLGAKLEDFDGAIDEAMRNGQTATAEAQQWKREAEEFVLPKVAAIQQDYEARRCWGGWSWNCVSINRRVTKELKEVQALISRRDVITVSAPQRPLPSELPISNDLVGMQSYLTEIVNQIMDENARVIGIYGMGGIGKTTLLKRINNLYNHGGIHKLKFEHVVWIVASKGCKLQKLQMDLAQNVGLNLKDDESEDACATKLFNFLKRKNCLLLLDDIWESYDLVKLGMEQTPVEHGMEQKRKVVVLTTRIEQACTEMRANMIKVEGLPSDQAWELFLKNTGENVINSKPGINQLARQIAKECAGVPLALITVGRAMSTKRSMEAWKDALTQLETSQLPELTGKKEGDLMFAAFKLSYDSLEDDNMRARLLCCSLWPEDFEIDKAELIQCWIGLGLIDEFNLITKAFDRGHSHIDALTSACLLELVDKECTTRIKMHDVIRDMALWMTSYCGSNQNRWIVKARAGLRQLELENEECQVVERASFMHNHLSFLPRQTTPTFPKLSMLMLQQNPNLVVIPASVFQSLPVLTFLDLSSTKIKELPKEINMLSELQHLNLNFTRIEALPAELSSLAKLKYLLLVGTECLVKVPQGTISNLSLLKLLDLYESRYANLDELEGFKGCRKCIGITLDSMATLGRLGSLPRLSIWKLQLQEMRDLAYPSQLFESMMNSNDIKQGLERLEIVDVVTGGQLTVARSNEDREEGLKCLKYMTLIAVKDLQEITWKEVKPQAIFPNLNELIIVRCKMLRNITWALMLPSLSVLRVSDCDMMEELISCVGSSINSTVGLNLLSLTRLPKLNCISQQPLAFPFLERMYVSSCPEFKKLPFGAEMCQNRLKGIYGQIHWWENIQWEDVNDKNSLLPYFKPTLREVVFQVSTEVANTEGRVLKTLAAIPGFQSLTFGNDLFTMICDEQLDVLKVVAILRKKFGMTELLRVDPY